LAGGSLAVNPIRPLSHLSVQVRRYFYPLAISVCPIRVPSMSTKATYGTGSLSETAPRSGVWRYRWHEDGKRMRATFGSKAEPLTLKQAERAIRNREPVAPATSTAASGLDRLRAE